MELELNASNIQASQNLLDISSANDSHGANESATTKKEGNLLSWFTSSSPSNASSSPTIAQATSSSPPMMPRSFTANEVEQLQDGSSSPNLKISSKLSYGEKFINKFNKNGNKATSSEQQPSNETAGAAGVSKEPQKSSRRTTSLLNLFMSNSQGKKHIKMHSVKAF